MAAGAFLVGPAPPPVVEWSWDAPVAHGQVWAAAVGEIVRGPAVAAGALDQWLRLAAGRMGHLVTTVGSYANRASLEFRYRSQGSGHLQAHVVCRVLGLDEHSALTDAVDLRASVADALPEGFHFEYRDAVPSVPDGAICEIRRTEEVLESAPWSEAAFYYAFRPRRTSVDTARAVLEAILSAAEPVVVSIVLQPTELFSYERSTLSVVRSGLAWDAVQHQQFDAFGDQVPLPGWEPAADADRMWRAFEGRLNRGLLHRVSVAGATPAVRRVASLLAAPVSSAPDDSEPPPSHSIVTADEISRPDARTALDLGIVLPWGGHSIWAHHSAPVSLQRLPYIVNEHEAASLLFLPVPTPTGCPGLPVASSRPSVTLPAVPPGALHLGRVIDASTSTFGVGLDVNSLTRHVLVAGLVGSGKSSTVQAILVQLWRDHGIPWLVIEPKPNPEYRALLHVPGLEELRVVPLARQEVAAARLNPLAIPDGVSVDGHVSSLMGSFSLAIDLFDPLPELLEESLFEVYERAGVLGEERPTAWPSLSELIAVIPDVFDRKGYRGEATNLRSALLVRLQALTRGAKGALLDTVESDDWAALLDAPAVVELRGIDNVREQTLIVAFIVQQVRAVAARRPAVGDLRHVVVLEEAHRLLPDVVREDPQHAAVQQLVHDVAEMRALGQGFVLCDQAPSRLHPAAVANTSTRILHRIASAHERESLLADIGATPDQAEAVGNLGTGEALVQVPAHQGCVFIEVDLPPEVNTSVPASDETIREAMRMHTDRLQRLLPLTACTREVCTAGCDPDRRTRGMNLARSARRSVDATGGRVLEGFTGHLASAGADGPTRYCALLHLDRDVGAVLPRDLAPEDRVSLARSIVDA